MRRVLLYEFAKGQRCKALEGSALLLLAAGEGSCGRPACARHRPRRRPTPPPPPRAALPPAGPEPGRPGCGLGGCMRRGHRLRRERDGAAASRSDLAASAEASLQSRSSAACIRPVHTPRASLQSLQSWSAAASPAAASPNLASTMESQAVVATRLASAMESGAPVAWGRAKDGARSGGAATWASGSLSSQSKPARRSESVEACVAVPAGARR